VPKKRSVEDLTVDELRWLLMEKRRAARQERLKRYRKTGRVVVVAPDLDGGSLGNLSSSPLVEDDAGATRSRRKRILDGFLLVVEISGDRVYLCALQRPEPDPFS
jgi:sortase A